MSEDFESGNGRVVVDVNCDKIRLQELAILFLKLGSTAFGGPAAHIAMMRQEFVEKRKCLDENDFLDLISACNLIPGPNSTELAIHLGYRFGGYRGLLLAGVCFITPAFLIVLSLAYLYVKMAFVPELKVLFDGVRPVVLALVLDAVLGLSTVVLKNLRLIVLGALAFILCFLVKNELFILLLSGLITLCAGWIAKNREIQAKKVAFSAVFILICMLMVLSFFNPFATATALSTPSPQSILLYFLKIGSILYGSGYVLLAFLQADLVEHSHWINSQQLFDAISIGQMTPGPVFTTATFIGFILQGGLGAALATLGIFAPAFILVAITAPAFKRLKENEIFTSVLQGVNVASLSLMLFVLTQLFAVAANSPLAVAVFLVSFLLLRKFKMNVSILILLSAGLNLLMRH